MEDVVVDVADSELADVRARLDRTRLPEPETAPGDTQGLGLRQLSALLDAWREHDWRARQAQWNAIPQYRVRLDGLRIAFWHVRSPEPTALPLLLTHGWPGSVLEFENPLGPLTDPVAHGGSARDAFHVVVPSLPGFGFSDRPDEQGWHPGRTAGAWAELMTLLGYDRFGAHGGELGRLREHGAGSCRSGAGRGPAPDHAARVTAAGGPDLSGSGGTARAGQA
ncbi:epoxide hydrolase [Kibdelosporangium phytohabitans]|uniref:epoxide hydrolase family protein n=1 Tax=Kibdelosporangium phytohabitans TaxID=860235 RepID=UPI000AD7695C|nr:hypothetical protein [Kibdelosporangium phytohabitans]